MHQHHTALARGWGGQPVGHRLVASYPTSAAAHAALGDVAAADHAYREAVEWYELAQRLEPSDSVRLRLVHERWADTGAARRQSTEAFERLVDRVAGRATQVTLACHDPQTLDRSVEQLRRAGSAVTLELQPDQPRQGVLWVARSRQVPVRSLLHYGRPAAPTRLGTLARQPRVLWWSTLSSSLSTLLPA